MFIDDKKQKKLEAAVREQFERLRSYVEKLRRRYDSAVPPETEELSAVPECLRPIVSKSIA